MFVFDATIPAVPRLMALNIVAPSDIDMIVSVITPSPSNLYLAVEGVTTQLDNSVPQNSIELYFPPAALSNAVPITDVVSHDGFTLGPTAGSLSRRSIANGYAPDRFGVVRHGGVTHFAKHSKAVSPKTPYPANQAAVR